LVVSGRNEWRRFEMNQWGSNVETCRKPQVRKGGVKSQHPCRDRNDSHTLMQCTVDSIYCSTCVVI